MNPAKQQSQSYSALTQQVVCEAEEPIPVAEIARRVQRLRPIEAPSPERVIRNAIAQCRLVANTGDGRYWWYPRLLKVTLCDFDRPIWRRLLVPGDTTLGDLHWILQLSMGWTHSHLHLFEVDDARYSDPSFDLDEAPDEFRDEFRARLDRVDGGEGARFLYEYDFGDSWRHEIEIEKILPATEGETYPKLVAGERACPPEDCGGGGGYANFLEEIGDENHPEHERSLQWAGGYFDPERLDVEGVNWLLRKFAEIE